MLPLFLFSMSLLILPMKIMDTSRIMQAVAESVCRDASVYAYTFVKKKNGDASELKDSGNPEQDESSSRIMGFLSGNGLALYAAEKAKEQTKDLHVKNILPLRSDCMSDGENIRITLDYTYSLPFSVFGLPGIPQQVTAYRRAWIGDQTGQEESSREEDSDEDPIVYVGKSSTRYHLSRSCHYLSNDLSPVPLSAVSALRNSGGAKYHACPRCSGGVTGGTVYIMESGTAYHADPDCTAIISYVRAVRKSTVEYLGPCSYCGGSHE